MITSTNSVVRNALAAASAKPDILDYVKKAPYAATVKRDGRVIRYASLVVPFSKADKVYREVERYLAKRVSIGICRFVNNPCFKGVRENYFYLTVEIPDLAVKNAVVARNADDGTKVRVVAESETLFGKRREERTMTVGELRAAMTRIGHGRLFADVVRNAEAGRDANPLLKLPCEAWITLA